jgi:RNA polymerase sigma factor FliA
LRQPDDRLSAEQQQLIIEYLPIVRFITRHIHERLPQQVAFEDLYSAGVVGLMDALGKFDPAKQVKFRSYAQFRIRSAILDSLRTLDWSRAANNLEAGNEMRIGLYQQPLGELKSPEIGTLRARQWENSREEKLVDPPNRPDDDPLVRCLHAEMRELLTEAIRHLPERERMVMTLYYYEEMTMKEVGIILGVMQARVSQIHASAVLHLRARLADPADRRATLCHPEVEGSAVHSTSNWR